MAEIELKEKPYINLNDEEVKEKINLDYRNKKECIRLKKHLTKYGYDIDGEVIHRLYKPQNKKIWIFNYIDKKYLGSIWIWGDIRENGLIKIDIYNMEDYKHALKIKDILKSYQTKYDVEINCQRDKEAEMLKQL